MVKDEFKESIPNSVVVGTRKKIEKDPAYLEWGESYKQGREDIELPPAMTYGLAEFCYMTGLTPTQIIEKHREWKQGKAKAEKHEIVKLLKKVYRPYLQNVARAERGPHKGEIVSYSTAKTRDTGVRSFVTHAFGDGNRQQGIPIGNMKKPKTGKTKVETYTPNVQEVGKLLRHSKPGLERFQMAFSSQSCTRPDDKHLMKYTEEIRRQVFDEEQEVVVFSYWSKKAGCRRITAFCGQAVEYFKECVRMKRMKVGDPLFIGQERQPIDYSGLNDQFNKIRDLAGFKAYPSPDQHFRYYSLTSFGMNALNQGYGDPMLTKWIHGHEGVDEHYTDGNNVRKAYTASLEYLNPEYKAESDKKAFKDRVLDKLGALERLAMKQQGIIEEQQRQMDILKNGISFKGNKAEAFKEAAGVVE